MYGRVLLPLLLLLAMFFSPTFGPWFGVPQGVAQDDPLQATTRTVNVELILDASGSMAESLPSGETRMAAAQRILREVIQGLPEREGVNVGLRVYGHLGDNTESGKQVSCRSSELLVPIAGLGKPALIQQVDAIHPTGWTPIAYSLAQAAADFQPGGESITNAIVLVTDGEETCDPPEQACQAAEALLQADVSVTTHVVGFALTPQQTEQVSCIAEQGGGQLFGADDAAGLGTAIGSALEGVGVSITPVAIPAAAAPVPLAEIHTLAYHQLTAWTTGPNVRGEEAPILSDDGQRIAFARAPGTTDPATPNRIFVMNADGAGEQEIDAYTALCGCGALLDLSADGSRIVSSDSMQLRIAEASGGGGRELLALDSNELNAVRISGDGSRVVFRIYRDTTVRNTSPSQPIERGIYVINADGSGLRQIVGPATIAALLGVTPAQAPFFGGTSGLDTSANGARIVFTAFTADIDPTTGGGVREGLFAVNGDGSGLLRLLGLTFTFVTANAISSDGATVAFVTNDFGSRLQEAGVIGFDGSAPRALTDSTTLHPGTGYNLPSGERIQLSADGSRLLLGSTGLLYDTTGGVLALGVGAPGVPSDRTPLVGDGLIGATMDAAATRAVYLFQPVGEPHQLARVDLNPSDLGLAPTISEPRVAPAYILTEGGSTATVSARVGTTAPFLGVGSRVLREGLPDDNTRTSPLLDGAAGGDAMANDGVFTSDGIFTDCCAVLGPRVVRIKAETQAADGLRHATAIDVAPFAVVAEIPAAGGLTPTVALPDQVITPTATPAVAIVTPPATVAPPAIVTPTPNIPPAVVTPTVAATLPPAATTEAGPGTQSTPVIASETEFITPDPAECFVTPRSAEEMAAIVAAPDQAARDALLAAMGTPGLNVPAGQPADEATMAAVVATYREITACFNAGNDLAAYALWTDEALRQLQLAPATGVPVPPAARKSFRVTQAQVLPDGRVAVVWDERGSALTTTLVEILVQEGGRYLVDETLDASLA